MSKSWTLAGLKASVYKFSGHCCGRDVALAEAEFDGLIQRYGPQAEWNDLSPRVVCKDCRKPLRFVLSMRDQKPYDMSRAFLASASSSPPGK